MADLGRCIFDKSLKNNSTVKVGILNDNKWVGYNPTLLIHNNPNIDIAVLRLNTNDLKKNLFDIGNKNYYLSQDCYFLGFPFGLKMEDSKMKINNGFPIPFVKKGIISSFITDSNNVTQIFIDGHNNPGFSGGPVVVENIDKSEYKMRIIGVVSAYLNQEQTINTPFGSFKSNENSGIVLSYGISHIYEIIN